MGCLDAGRCQSTIKSCGGDKGMNSTAWMMRLVDSVAGGEAAGANPDVDPRIRFYQVGFALRIRSLLESHTPATFRLLGNHGAEMAERFAREVALTAWDGRDVAPTWAA